MTRLILIVSLLVFLGAGCKGGPRVRTCIASPPAGFECHDAEKDREYFIEYEKSDGYVCKSPDDFQTYLISCKKKQCVLQLPISRCHNSVTNNEFTCKQPGKEDTSMLFSNMKKHVCHPSIDQRTLDEYCQDKCGK